MRNCAELCGEGPPPKKKNTSSPILGIPVRYCSIRNVLHDTAFVLVKCDALCEITHWSLRSFHQNFISNLSASKILISWSFYWKNVANKLTSLSHFLFFCCVQLLTFVGGPAWNSPFVAGLQLHVSRGYCRCTFFILRRVLCVLLFKIQSIIRNATLIYYTKYATRCSTRFYAAKFYICHLVWGWREVTITTREYR